jgi:hypothetical protein
MMVDFIYLQLLFSELASKQQMILWGLQGKGSTIIELVWPDISSGPCSHLFCFFHLHISASLHNKKVE